MEDLHHEGDSSLPTFEGTGNGQSSAPHQDDFVLASVSQQQEQEDSVVNNSNIAGFEDEEDVTLSASNARADEDFSNDFNNDNNSNRRHPLYYCYSVSRLLVVDVIFDWTSAENVSLLSKGIRVTMTICSYFLLYTTFTGHLLWGIAYLNDHGWYLLAASGSVTLLLLSAVVLTSYEWMWRWQERCFLPLIARTSSEYSLLGGSNQRRAVTVHDDGDMDDDLSLRAWLKRFVKLGIACVVWLLYCMVNLKVDFWVTDQYMTARPQYHRYELQLVNGLEAAPILVGAAVLLYVAYLPFYAWHGQAPRDGVIAVAQVHDDASSMSRQDDGSTLQSLL